MIAEPRYAELVRRVDRDEWHLFVVAAAAVVENATGVNQRRLALGLLEAKHRGDDLTEFGWRCLLWKLGSEADFYERLERAVDSRKQANTVGSVAK